MLHQIGNGMQAIANVFLQDRGYQRDRFCLVQTKSPGNSLLGKEACLQHFRNTSVTANDCCEHIQLA